MKEDGGGVCGGGGGGGEGRGGGGIYINCENFMNKIYINNIRK